MVTMHVQSAPWSLVHDSGSSGDGADGRKRRGWCLVCDHNYGALLVVGDQFGVPHDLVNARGGLDYTQG